MDLSEYEEMYSFLEEKIGNGEYLPHIKDFDKWVSPKDWMMIPPPGCENMDQAKELEKPNAWFFVREDIRSGLHWAHVPQTEKLMGLLHPLNKKFLGELEKAFQNLEMDYELKVQKKIHRKGWNHVHPADFKDYKVWKTRNFTSGTAEEIIEIAN